MSLPGTALPIVPGAARRSVGRRERDEPGLRRAVEVEDDVAERIHELDGERPGQRRAAGEHDPERARVVPLSCRPLAAP